MSPEPDDGDLVYIDMDSIYLRLAKAHTLEALKKLRRLLDNLIEEKVVKDLGPKKG